MSRSRESSEVDDFSRYNYDEVIVLNIRTATLEDLQAVTAVEATCFPPAEAATEADFRDRLTHYGNHFWLLFDEKGQLLSFVDGMVTDEPDLTDEMYAHASLHNERGAWQMYLVSIRFLPAAVKAMPGHYCRLPLMRLGSRSERGWY